MPRLHLTEDEYVNLMERIYKVLSRTEQFDQVTHHHMWEVWRLLYFSNEDRSFASHK